jgi:hypothetical protein
MLLLARRKKGRKDERGQRHSGDTDGAGGEERGIPEML